VFICKTNQNKTTKQQQQQQQQQNNNNNNNKTTPVVTVNFVSMNLKHNSIFASSGNACHEWEMSLKT
jgi:cysteine sulfinate desulfinase/cysteine desulfurase-like protein